MAIWQYRLYVLPEEEVDSYLFNQDSISNNTFNEIDWWKYRQINKSNFVPLMRLLGREKSWSENIVQFGDIDSTCVEILFDAKKTIEISIRIDIRTNYKHLIRTICEFGQANSCVFLNESLKIIEPNAVLLQQDIDNDEKYQSFFSSLQ